MSLYEPWQEICRFAEKQLNRWMPGPANAWITTRTTALALAHNTLETEVHLTPGRAYVQGKGAGREVPVH